MSDPINLTNADFTFKDKNGNTGSNKGITDLDKTKLNNMVKLLNLLLNTPNSLNFVNTLANINLSNLSASGTGIINSLIDTKLSDKANATDLANYLRLSGGNITGNLTVQNKNVATEDFVNDSINNIDLGGGLEVGDIALAPLGIDETDNCRRYLNGQVILQSQFVAFTEKLKHAITLYPNLATTEQNWQSAVTLSPLGQCGKFVIDDEAGTIRLPKVVNVMGALDLSTIGQTVEAGLPAHTHKLYIYGEGGNANGGLQNFMTSNSPSVNGYADTKNYAGDIMEGNNIYGNSETVQQEAIKYPYFIQVATSNNEDVQIDTQVRLNNPFSLFMPYWSPIELNNLSWLRSNKQWNNGSVYTSAYEFLLSKYNSGTEQTETIADVSVTYILADNGMKIITDKSKYDALISASGSAWFFVLDTENTQFILPYTNGFAQFGGELGKFTEAGLPNITGSFPTFDKATGWYVDGRTFYGVGRWSAGLKYGDSDNWGLGVGFKASGSSPIYGKSDTVQPNSVTGYLYFYVGEVEQDANIIATSGLATDIANLKSRKYIIDEFVDSTSGYRIWSDGYCEQWGYFDSEGATYNLRTISFLKEFKDINYQVHTTIYNEDYTGAAGPYYFGVHNKTTTSFQTYFDSNIQRKMWKVSGYLKEGEY